MRIALRASTGYVTAEQGGELQPKRGIVTANRSKVGAWEIWTVEPNGTAMALKSANGFYLCAEGGGGGIISANRAVADGWEAFMPIPGLADGQAIRLQTFNGAFLSVSKQGFHVVDAAGEASTFTVEVIEADTAPAQPPAGPVGGHEDGPLDTYDGGARLAYGFKDKDGKPWFLAGYSVHLLPNLIDRGDDPGSIIAEAQGYGANTLIPICTHRSQWKKDNGYLFDPLADEGRFQRVMETMCQVTAAAKIRLAPAILADVQDLNTSQQQRIVDLATEVFARYELVLPRKGNECNANGYDPSRLNMNKVQHLLWSHGSYGENNPPLHTGARWAEWEGRRDYHNGYHKAMDDAGAGILELNNGYTGAQGQIGPFHCPMVGIEMPYFADTDPDHVGDRRWTDPLAALQLGLNLGANAAGMGAGTSLGLECKPNGPVAAECMRQQFKGAWAAFLR